MAFPAALPSANKVVVFKLRGQTLNLSWCRYWRGEVQITSGKGCLPEKSLFGQIEGIHAIID